MLQALLMQSVSDEIEFPKQWMRDAWNTHFMSPLSVSIMQDLYWWVFRTLHCLRSLLGVTGLRCRASRGLSRGLDLSDCSVCWYSLGLFSGGILTTNLL